MTIDLTRPEEQDWLSGDTPSLRYTELVSESDVRDEVRNELVVPLSRKLKPLLPNDRREEFGKLEGQDYELIAIAILHFLPDEQLDRMIDEAKSEVDDEGVSGREYASEYVHTLVRLITDRLPPIRVRLVGKYVAQFKDLQWDDPDVDSSGSAPVSEEQFESVIQFMHEKGIDRLEVA